MSPSQSEETGVWSGRASSTHAQRVADVYAWSYRRTSKRFETIAQVVGFDEIAAPYRTSRRGLVTDLVREGAAGQGGRVDQHACAGQRRATTSGEIHLRRACGTGASRCVSDWRIGDHAGGPQGFGGVTPPALAAPLNGCQSRCRWLD
jgi:hypothetical protein